MPRGVVKVALALLGAVYLISPIDVLPDFLGVFGRIDDLVVLALIAWRLLASSAPPPVEEAAVAAAATGPRDPWAVFDLTPGASAEEIDARYRKLCSLYHPDKVNHLGPELQRTAHEQMLAIQAAYAALKQSPPGDGLS